MTENSTRYLIGWLLVILHFVVILLAIGLFVAGGFNFDQLTTMLAIIVPMFAGYTTSIISFLTKDRYTVEDRSRKVRNTFVILSFVLPVIFAILIAGSVVLQS